MLGNGRGFFFFFKKKYMAQYRFNDLSPRLPSRHALPQLFSIPWPFPSHPSQSIAKARPPTTHSTTRTVGHFSGRGLGGQSATPATGEDAHDAEADVEEHQGIGDERTHAAHAADGTEHAAAAVGAPGHGGTGEGIAAEGVHGGGDADEAGQDEGQETVAQHAAAAEEGEGGGGVVVLVVMHLHAGGVVRGGHGGGGGVEEGVGHEAEDEVEGDGADGGETVDVAEVDFAGL